MRCEDCLPLIEEYFDGEVTGQTAKAVSVHLSTCATCAAALDALSFEQEIYARYDRGGLEVTPDLWARVSAEIARTPPTEAPAEGRPFLSRARGYLAAALGALALRPALASSLALLLVAAAAGTLWLSRKTRPDVTAPETARQAAPAPPPAAVTPRAADNDDPGAAAGGGPQAINEGETAPGAYEPRGPREEAGAAQNTNAARRGGADIDVARLLNDAPAAKDDQGVVKFGQEEEHA